MMGSAEAAPPSAGSGAPMNTFSPATSTSDAPLDDRLDDVLKRAGIAQTDQTAARAAEAARGPESPLSKIPAAGQELLEKFFGGGAIIFGSAFIIAGIAVAVEACCKVAGVQLPTAVDEAIIQFVEPALTPSILILFGFSISLGVLKQVRQTRARRENTPTLMKNPADTPPLLFARRSCSSAPRTAESCTRRTMTERSRGAACEPQACDFAPSSAWDGAPTHTREVHFSTAHFSSSTALSTRTSGVK